MSAPIRVDIPHRVGRAEARRRIEGGLGKLPGYLPRGAEVRPRWAGDRLDLDIVLGDSKVEARLDIRETSVLAEFTLPGIFALFAGPITAALREKGGQLLEDKRDDDA